MFMYFEEIGGFLYADDGLILEIHNYKLQQHQQQHCDIILLAQYLLGIPYRLFDCIDATCYQANKVQNNVAILARGATEAIIVIQGYFEFQNNVAIEACPISFQ